MPGPPPTPTALLKLSGTWRSKARKEEPKPAKGAQCPDWIDDYAREVWKKEKIELDRLGILTCVDAFTFACYCQAVADLRDAVQTIREEGKTTTTDKGYVIAHPAVAMKHKAMLFIKSFGAEFGLTAAARTRVSTANRSEKPKDNKARFFKGPRLAV